MSMTLIEAILHAKEKANECGPCAEEHRQLAEWLSELQQRREVEAPTTEPELLGECFNCQKRVVISDLKVVKNFWGGGSNSHKEICSSCREKIKRDRAEKDAQYKRIQKFVEENPDKNEYW